MKIAYFFYLIFLVCGSLYATDEKFCKFNQGKCSHSHGFVQDYGYGGLTSMLTTSVKKSVVGPIGLLSLPENPECVYNVVAPITTGAARLWNGPGGSATLKETEAIQCAGQEGKGYRIGGGEVSELVHTVKEMDDLQEELVFLTAIDNVRKFNDCQEVLFKSYFDAKSSTVRDEMVKNAWTQFSEINENLRPKLVEELRLRDQRNISESQKRCTRDQGCGKMTEKTVAAMVEASKGIDKRIDSMRGEINAILSRIPMANRDSMREAIERLILNEWPVSEQRFNDVYNREMKRLSDGVQKTKSFLKGITVPVKDSASQRLYCVDRHLKESLYRSGQLDFTVKQLGLEDVLQNFSRRSQNRYGMAGTVVTEVALIPTYFFGYGQARLALRAGVSSVKAATMSGRSLSSVTKLAMLGIEGLDYGSAISGAMADCHSNDFTAQVEGKSCNPLQEVGQVYQEASLAQCITSSILPFASPLVGTSVRLANSRGLQKLYSSGSKLDNDLILLAGKSGVYKHVSKGNEDLIEKYLLKMKKDGKKPHEIEADLKRMMRECGE